MADRKITQLNSSSIEDNDLLTFVDTDELDQDNKNKKITFADFWREATSSLLGVIKLTGDLGGTADSPTVPGLASKANINSPNFTGTPTAPTPSGGDSSTKLATTAFVSPLFTDFISILINNSVLNKEYIVVLDSPYSFKVTEITGVLTSGSCNLTIKKNGTAFVSATNLPVSSTESNTTFTPNLSFASGDDLIITISSETSPVDLNLTIVFTRA
jgi:hypothetical protein